MFNGGKGVTAMYRTNIYLDESQTQALRHLAAEERCSVAELVRREVHQYWAERLGDGKAWAERFDDLVAASSSASPPTRHRRRSRRISRRRAKRSAGRAPSRRCVPS